jgi:hypothetical protein
MDKEVKLAEKQEATKMEPIAKEKYQPVELMVLDVKLEKGYATSAGGETSPIAAPQWTDGNW